MNNYVQIGNPPDRENMNIKMTVTADTLTGCFSCDICRQPACQQYWENGELIATCCWQHPYIPKATQYNYKCPDCGGEFNEPASGIPSGTYVPYFCPFCNRKMEGKG